MKRSIAAGYGIGNVIDSGYQRWFHDPNNKNFTPLGLSKDRMATSSRKKSPCWSPRGSLDDNRRDQENP